MRRPRCSPTLSGSSTAQVDLTGGTPATKPIGPVDYSLSIPSPVPASGLPLPLPPSPQTLTGFTASGGSITVREDSSTSIVLIVAGSDLTLNCTAYPNDSVTPSGITTSVPTANPIAPVISGPGSTSSPFRITSATLLNGAVGATYSAILTASNGNPPYRGWSIEVGACRSASTLAGVRGSSRVNRSDLGRGRSR